MSLDPESEVKSETQRNTQTYHRKIISNYIHDYGGKPEPGCPAEKDRDREKAVIESVSTLKEAGNSYQFFASPLFSALVCLAFDPASRMLPDLRKFVAETTVAVSNDITGRKALVRAEIIHVLIKGALEQNGSAIAKIVAKPAVKTLYNAALLDITKLFPQPPELTQEQRQARIRIVQWGGLLCLWHIWKTVRGKDCLHTPIKDQMMRKELEAMVETIRSHMAQRFGIGRYEGAAASPLGDEHNFCAGTQTGRVEKHIRRVAAFPEYEPFTIHR